MKFLLMLCLSFFIFTACSDDDSPLQVNSNQMDVSMKLKVGSQWIHKATNYKNGVPDKVRFDTMKILAKHDHLYKGNNITLYITEYLAKGKIEQGYFQTNDDILFFEFDKTKNEIITTIFQSKRIVEKGQKDIKLENPQFGDLVITTEDIKIKHECLGKTYLCSKASIGGGNAANPARFESVSYRTKNIGEVALLGYMIDQTTKKRTLNSTTELVSYTE